MAPFERAWKPRLFFRVGLPMLRSADRRARNSMLHKPSSLGVERTLRKEAIMRNVFKFAAAATLTGALALAFAASSQAAGGRHAAAAAGFVAGAAVGGAATGVAYNNGYYYGDDYAYEPGYAYEAAPVYVAPSYSYDDYYPNRWQDQHSTNNFSISSQR
jgi:hypothetical protein